MGVELQQGLSMSRVVCAVHSLQCIVVGAAVALCMPPAGQWLEWSRAGGEGGTGLQARRAPPREGVQRACTCCRLSGVVLQRKGIALRVDPCA